MKNTEFITQNLYQTFLPAKTLRPFVKEYWIYDMKCRIGPKSTRELQQPILFPEVIFKMGVDYENYDVKQNKIDTISSSTICGIQSRAKASARIDITKNLLLIGIVFEYAGLYELLNIPLIEFCDKSIPKNDVSSDFLNKLEYLLQQAKGTNEILATLNQTLINYFYNASIDKECLQFNQILNSPDATSLAQLKANTGQNYKYLERRFKKYIGVTPKKYFKLKRYLSFYESWLKHDDYNYIDLVYRYDFFDQNHLIKDFKSVLNQSPNHFKKTKRNQFSEYIIHFKLNLLDQYDTSFSHS